MIKIQAVLTQVAHLPRRHLGFYLYEPKLSAVDPVNLAPETAYILEPNLLPSFRDHENCTYTVRVSRSWLADRHRAAICARQFLWGSGIYTDDSDPIAAAIHSGFIKGAWDASVAVDVLEDIIKEQNPKVDYAENVPSSPVAPPPDRDLHITLLVLPQLERYEGSIRYGQKSRTWPEKMHDAPHDGVSFVVLNCEWVDEGSSRGQGRTGAAKRQRLQSSLSGPPRRPGMGEFSTPTSTPAVTVGA